jgi:ABC-type multidrug transport system fused ATPase/permease subunit
MNRNHLLRLLEYVRQHWKLLPFVLVSMIAATLLDLAAPWIIGVILIA